jgi:hypothetical protein
LFVALSHCRFIGDIEWKSGHRFGGRLQRIEFVSRPSRDCNGAYPPIEKLCKGRT